MQKMVLALSLMLAFGTFSAVAHNGVDHSKKTPLTNTEAYSYARHVISQGIDSKRLESSWKQSRELSAEKITVDDKQQWLVKFSNMRVEDAAQKTLFIFLSPGGNYINANFTGAPGQQ